jgi:outer membrane protein assembly factor BamE (lipoprotein component of BamABCDE complex)
MAGDNDKNKKGFSGLSDLASDVSGIDEPIKPEPKAEAKPSTPKQPPQPQREAAPSEPKRKTTSSPPPIEPASSGKSGGGSGGKWVLGIIGVIFVIWLINNGGQSNKKPSYTPPSSSQSYSYPQSTPAPAVQTPSTTQSAGLQYTKPSVGTNNVLSVPEIRWCIREGIRIEAMRDVIDNNAGIDEFNRIVNDYNSRCGSYRYREGSQSRAERDVEAYRSQIVSEAIREARQLGRSYQPSYPSVSPGVSTSTAPKKPNAQYTREAQQLLTDLGYDPGPVDGDYGRRTADAVKAFQRDVGTTQDGWIDEDLLSTLRRAKAAYKPPVVSQPKPQTQASVQPRSSTPSATTTATAGYFTRGSHQDEVLRIQGTPSRVNKYSDHEVWNYGLSSVDISLRDRRVTEWNNISGNLKVRLAPGGNVTSSPYFTRGSHQDDVLRVQGTPSSINRYSDHEVWNYGLSSVDISSRDRRVTEWNNISGNLKARMSPGSNVTNNPYFTRGSHQDDVLRVQGTPSSINRYSDHEVWNYGLSSVDISARDRRVTEWNNISGNLKVRLSPGGNVTSNTYFGRGSHQDDVLRIQGTPTSISRYSDHEVWSFGLSSVDISTRSRQVTDWNNISGNLKVR